MPDETPIVIQHQEPEFLVTAHAADIVLPIATESIRIHSHSCERCMARFDCDCLDDQRGVCQRCVAKADAVRFEGFVDIQDGLIYVGGVPVQGVFADRAGKRVSVTIEAA